MKGAAISFDQLLTPFTEIEASKGLNQDLSV
jgi:hypothetical protein